MSRPPRCSPMRARCSAASADYLLELPVIPGAGCIGRVRAVGPDATELAAGDWVFCDPTVRSRDDAQSPDIILQGLTAGSESAPAPAALLPRRLLGRAYARADGVRQSASAPIDPADAGAMVRVRQLASCRMAATSRPTCGRRDRPGERRDRCLRQRRRRRGAGDGRQRGDRHGPQRAGSDDSGAALASGAARQHGRRRGAGSRSHAGGGGGRSIACSTCCRPRRRRARCGPPCSPCGRTGGWC